MDFAKASRFADDHDVVLVGYRGVDGSVRLDAPEVESALKHSSDFLSGESFRAVSDAYSAAAKRLQTEGVDLAGYTMAEQVDDLETARVALGYGRVDLLSESAGTRTAMIYSWRYPKSIHRSVMIGVNPPGHFLWDPQTTDEQIARYSALYAKDDASRDGTTGDLAASMRYTAKHMPDRWLFLPIKDGNVRIASFFGLMESTSEATPFAGPLILNAWRSAADGDASGFWLASLISDLLFPEMFTWGEYAAIGAADAKAASGYFFAGRQNRESILGNPGTDFVWAGGRLGDAWPRNAGDEEYGRVQASPVETLLIGGTLDFSTPPQNATKELLPYLPNGRQVVLAEVGHSGSFWNEQPEAGNRLISAFLDSGQVDESLYKPTSVDFTPALGIAAVAKIVAGTMVAFALFTVLSLLWMARRVYKRGGFGPKASAMLRWVFPVVLGLGGWFFAALIAMTTAPSVPLDDELLVGLSVGLPIALSVYFAWADRDWSSRTKWTGFALAAGGAVVGAWLGFNATEGILGIITAVGGAIVGANLVPVALDISSDLQGRPRLRPRSSRLFLLVPVLLGLLGAFFLLGFSGVAQAGTTERVSVSTGGAQSNEDSYNRPGSISADGSYVAFASFASNLVSGDTNDTSDIFVRDRLTGQTTRVSVDSSGMQGNGWSYDPSISADGRYVAFNSEATNLVAGDTNDRRDVFVYDRVTGQTTRVSVSSGGTQGNGDYGSYLPSISADGRYVAFDSDANNLVSGDTNGYRRRLRPRPSGRHDYPSKRE